MSTIAGRQRGGRIASAGHGVGFMLAVAVAVRPSAHAASPKALSHPFDTDLAAAAAAVPPADERITAIGRSYRIAPTPDPDASRIPWDAARLIRDPRTGADTTAFGNAFNLGNLLGNDERSSETGGAFVAPRHQ